MLRSLTATSVVLLVLAAVVPSAAQAPPSADAFVISSQPAKNFGGSPILPVQAGTTSFIRLNLGAVPANSVIAKATLRLYVNAVVKPGSFDVFAVENPWNEAAISFNNLPVLGPSATGSRPTYVAATNANQFILVDITSLAQGWLNGSIPNNGLAIVLSGGSGSFSFDSKESGGRQPELEIAYSPVASRSAVSLGVRTANATFAGAQQNSDPYIDNGTSLQTGANFNIDGSGTASVLNATSQFQLNGLPVLGAAGSSGFFVGPGAGQNNTGNENLFIGPNAGQSNTSGDFNTYMGSSAGQANTTGSFNTFVGRIAGQVNTTGAYNSFFGSTTGYNNTTGSYNNFMGTYSGAANTTGSLNNFVGVAAGQSNTTGTFNDFVGTYAGQLNTTGTFNAFIGNSAGQANTTGHYNTMVGNNSGSLNTTGTYNAFLGGASGAHNTTGSSNVFVGMNAGFSNTTGTGNVFIGPASGFNANPAGNGNIYIANLGSGTDNNTVRIGDPSAQSSAYIAGINGSTTSTGVPVFIDSTGKLGTGGGTVSFSQMTGTLSSPQLTGAYSAPIVMSNTSNTFTGTFAGSGAGLTNVTSGLNWNIVELTNDYSVQLTDFATPTKTGNYLILIGKVSHTFTLPNPPPANGSCVAIGNVADPGINSNQNAYLTVSPNGVLMDTTTSGNSVQPTLPRRTSYLFCSDGTNYFRLGYQQNGVSEIGPWIKTVDTGTVNVMQTTFRNGMDFGLSDGSLILLQPKFTNTSSVVTLNVNGLGATRVLKYGYTKLAPGDLNPLTFSVMIYNANGAYWELVNPMTAQTLQGTTTSLGGSLISAGTCASGTVTVTGAIAGHPVSVSASDGSLPNPLVILSAAVTATDTVSVQLCAVADVSPTAKTYNVATQ